MNAHDESPWMGVNESARAQLETRCYADGSPAHRLVHCSIGAGELIELRQDLADLWIPGVEVLPRRVYQQKGRGYFSEIVRLNEGTLDRIGLAPKQWSSALMHQGSAKGFHIHPPHVPADMDPARWFARLFIDSPTAFNLRPYDLEQWDVMFILTGLCEMILVDERSGLPRRIMRIMIAGDSMPGRDNAGVVVPPGVAHALRCIGDVNLVMVYGTSTSFNPDWEGRIGSAVEKAPLPEEWDTYLRHSNIQFSNHP